MGETGFRDFIGPLEEGDGGGLAFTVEKRHLNGAGTVHGGMLMSFAGIVLADAAKKAADGADVASISLNCDFVGPAHEGDRVEGRAEITRRSRTVVFLNATLNAAGRTVLTATGLWRIEADT